MGQPQTEARGVNSALKASMAECTCRWCVSAIGPGQMGAKPGPRAVTRRRA